jgi:hypothetical protein
MQARQGMRTPAGKEQTHGDNAACRQKIMHLSQCWAVVHCQWGTTQASANGIRSQWAVIAVRKASITLHTASCRRPWRRGQQQTTCTRLGSKQQSTVADQHNATLRLSRPHPDCTTGPMDHHAPAIGMQAIDANGQRKEGVREDPGMQAGQQAQHCLRQPATYVCKRRGTKLTDTIKASRLPPTQGKPLGTLTCMSGRRDGSIATMQGSLSPVASTQQIHSCLSSRSIWSMVRKSASSGYASQSGTLPCSGSHCSSSQSMSEYPTPSDPGNEATSDPGRGEPAAGLAGSAPATGGTSGSPLVASCNSSWSLLVASCHSSSSSEAGRACRLRRRWRLLLLPLRRDRVQQRGAALLGATAAAAAAAAAPVRLDCLTLRQRKHQQVVEGVRHKHLR